MRAVRTELLLAGLWSACGLHFALLQTSYFFLLEAHLSSRSQSYFVALFFWLVGLLVGLWLYVPGSGPPFDARRPEARSREGRRLGALLAAGVLSYYIAFVLARVMPFSALLYPVCAACSVVSGVLPGYFFRFMGHHHAPVKMPLFHENNGFLVGLAIALQGAVHFGGWLLALGPLAGAALVATALAVAGREIEGQVGRRHIGSKSMAARSSASTSRIVTRP